VIDLDLKRPVVRAVTFDIWETLLFEEDGSDFQRKNIRCRALVEALNRLNVNVSVEQVEQALEGTVSSLLKVWDRNRDVSHPEQIRLFIKHLSKGKIVLNDESINEVSRAYVLPLFEAPPYLNPDAQEALDWLKDHRKRIGIICNTGLTPGSALRRFLSDSGVAESFCTMIFSNEVGVRKPDRRIFRLAAVTLGASPTEIVHVGDNLKSDVWGAKNAGFRGVYLSGNVGRDRLAESDPRSLVALSRNLGSSGLKKFKPDKTITSLSMIGQAIKEVEATV
jgi:putative hydrolase of the HAD superfamily